MRLFLAFIFSIFFSTGLLADCEMTISYGGMHKCYSFGNNNENYEKFDESIQDLVDENTIKESEEKSPAGEQYKKSSDRD